MKLFRLMNANQNQQKLLKCKYNQINYILISKFFIKYSIFRETKDSCTFTDEAGNHIQKKQDKKREKNIIANQTDDLDLNKKEHQEYQPLTYETYKFFIKFSPFVEKILTNNINKHILQTNQDLQELKAFSKIDKEYVLSKDLIEYVNLNNLPNYHVHFNSQLIQII